MEFEFNISKAKFTVFSFVLSSFIFLCLLYFLNGKVRQLYFQVPGLFIAILIIYCMYIALLIYRITFSANSLKIQITADELIVPNYHLGEKRIFLNRIFSLDNIASKKGELLMIGVSESPSILLDSSKFKSNDEFIEFKKELVAIVERNFSDGENIGLENFRLSRIKVGSSYLTWIFSLLCVFTFCLSLMSSLHGLSNEQFLYLGVGKKKALLYFDWYRAFSSSYIHANVFHLLINIFIFSMLGELLEKEFSRIKYLLVILGSSLAGYLSFILFSNYDYGAGFSGAVFGLLGAFIALRIRHEERLPGRLRIVPLKRIVFFVLLEFLIEFVLLKNVGLSVHLGGFVAGFSYVFLSTWNDKLDDISKTGLFEKYLAGVLGFAYLAGLAFFMFLVFKGEVANMPDFS